ncbi:hypothetical protein GQ55_6G265900 [Panicum hallii var. hallii]|uniref:Uncharacterized protein n=1 Tax=Panicum hallii var. hallii TaxID=1504633 RepID=A0A2T7D9W7_9POAL|nr:hypothetical protein GQ55_6G265900 [Panicum hallii var. hallii]
MEMELAIGPPVPKKHLGLGLILPALCVYVVKLIYLACCPCLAFAALPKAYACYAAACLLPTSLCFECVTV